MFYYVINTDLIIDCFFQTITITGFDMAVLKIFRSQKWGEFIQL